VIAASAFANARPRVVVQVGSDGDAVSGHLHDVRDQPADLARRPGSDRVGQAHAF
jgi:hypothetical protein